MAFNHKEIATLLINGREYTDWTKVEVVHNALEAFPMATFECTEEVSVKMPNGPITEPWRLLQITVGDECEVYLGGKLAITGYVVVRQAGYDATSHAVQIIVMGKTFDTTVSSAVTQTGNFDGYSWEAIARKLLAPFGIGLSVIGTLDAEPFPKMQIQPGELVWATLERLARSRKINLGSDPYGNLLAIGTHNGTMTDSLIEGQNILRATCVFEDRYVMQKHYATGQQAGNDKTWGSEAAEVTGVAPGVARRYKPLVAVIDHPETQSGAQKRAEFEAQLRNGMQIQAQITVQGWHRPSDGDLWRLLTYPHVYSPMLLLDTPLGIQQITFRQDEGGTTTTLNLVRPDMLGGYVNWGKQGGASAAPQGDQSST